MVSIQYKCLNTFTTECGTTSASIRKRVLENRVLLVQEAARLCTSSNVRRCGKYHSLSLIAAFKVPVMLAVSRVACRKKLMQTNDKPSRRQPQAVRSCRSLTFNTSTASLKLQDGLKNPRVAVLSDGHHTHFGNLLSQILGLSSLAERPVSRAYPLPTKLLPKPSRDAKLITCCIRSCNVEDTWSLSHRRLFKDNGISEIC